MKNILILIIGLSLSFNLYALDLSSNGSKDRNSKTDVSDSFKKDMNKSNSEEKSKTKTNTEEKSLTKSFDLKKIEQTDALTALLALEYAGIEPFKSCSVLTKPRLSNDLGLGCRTRRGMINSNRCSALSEAAQSNVYLVDIDIDEQKVKEYMSCVGLYGSLIAQDMKQGKFSPELKNGSLKETYLSFVDSLEYDECRLDGSITSITCGSTNIKIATNPSLIFGSITLYSDNSFFGYTSSISESKSNRTSDSYIKSKSRKRSKAKSMAKSFSINNSTGKSLSKSASANLSMSKFIPGE